MLELALGTRAASTIADQWYEVKRCAGPRIWELEEGNSRDLGKGSGRRLKAHERGWRGLKRRRGAETTLIVGGKQGKVKGEAATWWEKHGNGQRGLNHNNGEGQRVLLGSTPSA